MAITLNTVRPGARRSGPTIAASMRTHPAFILPAWSPAAGCVLPARVMTARRHDLHWRRRAPNVSLEFPQHDRDAAGRATVSARDRRIRRRGCQWVHRPAPAVGDAPRPVPPRCAASHLPTTSREPRDAARTTPLLA